MLCTTHLQQLPHRLPWHVNPKPLPQRPDVLARCATAKGAEEMASQMSERIVLDTSGRAEQLETADIVFQNEERHPHIQSRRPYTVRGYSSRLLPASHNMLSLR
jgi:hypothetical protein